NLPGLEKQEGWNGIDPVLDGQLLGLIGIDLPNFHLARIFARQFLEHGRDHLARAAPFRPEIHDDRRGRLQHFLFEIRVREGKDVRRRHRITRVGSVPKWIAGTVWTYFSCINKRMLTTAPRPITAAAIAKPRSKPLILLAAGAGACAGGRGAGAPGGRGAGEPVEVGGRATVADGAPDVGGRSGAGAAAGAGVKGLDGEGAAGAGPGAAGAGPPGIEGSLMVAVDEGFGGRLMRTVSFLG